jgi:hypothetical protein
MITSSLVKQDQKAQHRDQLQVGLEMGLSLGKEENKIRTDSQRRRMELTTTVIESSSFEFLFNFATLGPSWNFSLSEILASLSLQDGPQSGTIITRPPHKLWKIPHKLWQIPHKLWQIPHKLWQIPHKLWQIPHNLWQIPHI